MDAKLDDDGYLLIYRTTGWKYQICPFSTNENICGDWCPLFRDCYFNCTPCFGSTMEYVNRTAKDNLNIQG